MKKALITGAYGQQSAYLTEFLLEKGYFVNGIVRQAQESEYSYHSFHDNFQLHVSEMTDYETLYSIIVNSEPDEIYNLAAMNDVPKGFAHPTLAMDVNCCGLTRIIEAVQESGLTPKIYQALSSEIFGNPVESPQNELTPLNPRSSYGVSKCAAFQLAKIYRDKYGMQIYCGIIFNNESPRRPEIFLSRKVCKHVASLVNGNAGMVKLKLGNLETKKDFGFAGDYAEWAWRIVQHNTPTDFILATGVTHTVGEFVEEAFKYIGIKNWEDYIELDPALYRPSEVKVVVGDRSKSKRLLNFQPKTTFKELISIMMEHELKQYDK